MSDTPRTDARKRWISGHAVIEKWPSFAGEQEVVDAGFAETLERELAAERERNIEVRSAAVAVVVRWDTPDWKDVPPTAQYINRLRHALAESQGEALAAAEKGEKG